MGASRRQRYWLAASLMASVPGLLGAETQHVVVPSAPTGPPPTILDAAMQEAQELPDATFWPRLTDRAIRGLTLGPIENTLHSTSGYGTEACAEALLSAARFGANWVSLTPFGRVWDLTPSGVELSFEASFDENVKAVRRAVHQAHASGLKVLLVPHLWVETGDWRALIHFEEQAAGTRFRDSYRRFLLRWAALAQQMNVDLFSVGVEWRSWVTSTEAPSFVDLIADVRKVYKGPLTYAANWDDAAETVIWGELDVIGINAFYPLTDRAGAELETLVAGGEALVTRVEQLSKTWQKPVLFTEIGYTTRTDPALRPWEWPDSMDGVIVDERAQAEAYLALLAGFIDEPWFMGFFVWRAYSGWFDTSQEAAWGFSPLHKQSELVLRDAFARPFASEGPAAPGFAFATPGARRVGSY